MKQIFSVYVTDCNNEVFADKMLVKKLFAKKVLAKIQAKFSPNEREFS